MVYLYCTIYQVAHAACIYIYIITCIQTPCICMYQLVCNSVMTNSKTNQQGWYLCGCIDIKNWMSALM